MVNSIHQIISISEQDLTVYKGILLIFIYVLDKKSNVESMGQNQALFLRLERFSWD